jgi:HEAT repeat protein
MHLLEVLVRKLVFVCLAFAVVSPAFADAPKNDANAERHLIDRLCDSDPRVRAVAAGFLGQLNPASRGVVTALETALVEDADIRVRQRAAQSLGTVGARARKAAPALAKALETDAAPEVRAEAARTLGLLAPAKEVEATRPALALALIDENEGVRAEAAEALRKVAPVSAEKLIADLKAADAADRVAAVGGLAALGVDARDAVEPLKELLTDEKDPLTRKLIRRALEEIQKEDN